MAARDRWLRWKYGLTSAQVDAMVINQGGLCACCGELLMADNYARWHVDHNHRTKVIRGILCTRCNSAAGLVGDNAAGARRLLDYLARFE